MKNVLLFASKSVPRRELLQKAHIPFLSIAQDADESQCDWGIPFRQLLASIAVHKMNHAIVPEAQEGEHCFVLTVDTMLQAQDGTILGKPSCKEAAIKMIQASRDGGIVASAFCLDKKIFKHGAWIIEQRIQNYVSANYVLDFPDFWIEKYFEEYPEYLSIAGALNIEEYGMQFVKTIDGSYSTAIGLPLYELREALESLGFFDSSP